jgi:preprotein translocase SecE subunit
MAEKEKRNLATRISDWFRATKSEFKKIVWPTPAKIAKDTGIVLMFVIVFGAFIYGLQWLFRTGIQFLLPN